MDLARRLPRLRHLHMSASGLARDVQGEKAAALRGFSGLTQLRELVVDSAVLPLLSMPPGLTVSCFGMAFCRVAAAMLSTF